MHQVAVKSTKPFHLNVIVNRRFGTFGREQVAICKLTDEEKMIALRAVLDGPCHDDQLEVVVVGHTDYGQKTIDLVNMTDDEMFKVMTFIITGDD